MKQRRSAGSFVTSVVIHVAIALAFARMVFTYPLGNTDGIPRNRPETPEEIHYIRMAPQAPETSGGAQHKLSAHQGAPAALLAPAVIPNVIPIPLPPNQAPARAAGGAGTGKGVANGTSPVTGLIPAQPDPRIRLVPQPVLPQARTPAERLDSVISEMYGVILDSAAAAAHQRKPGDWTHTTDDGKKYGWDPAGIHLGNFTIPNALLALLPLNNLQANPTLNSRNAAAVRADVMYQGQMQVTEDEFHDAVKRVRERKEREHQAELKRKAARDSSSSVGGHSPD